MPRKSCQPEERDTSTALKPVLLEVKAAGSEAKGTSTWGKHQPTKTSDTSNTGAKSRESSAVLTHILSKRKAAKAKTFLFNKIEDVKQKFYEREL